MLVKTHDVFNQSRPLEDYNLFSSHPALGEIVTRFGGQWGEDSLAEFGQVIGRSDVIEHGRLANENPPVLKAFDAFGRRVNVVEYHPSYHALMALSMARPYGLPWTEERSGAWLSVVPRTS